MSFRVILPNLDLRLLLRVSSNDFSRSCSIDCSTVKWKRRKMSYCRTRKRVLNSYKKLYRFILFFRNSPILLYKYAINYLDRHRGTQKRTVILIYPYLYTHVHSQSKKDGIQRQSSVRVELVNNYNYYCIY